MSDHSKQTADVPDPCSPPSATPKEKATKNKDDDEYDTPIPPMVAIALRADLRPFHLGIAAVPVLCCHVSGRASVTDDHY
eukprot:757894-Hanusia_phi.AAC.6